MSIELNWETLTGGPDGAALAESIRDFIHTKFQSVPLPRFIKSVRVHEFAFGNIPPDVVLKDICDPLPDFYEQQDGDDDDDDDDEDDDAGGNHDHAAAAAAAAAAEAAAAAAAAAAGYGNSHSATTGNRNSRTTAGYGGAGARGPEEFIPDSIRAAERRRRAEQSRRLGIGAGGHGSKNSNAVANTTPPVALGGGATEFPFPPAQHIHAAGLRSGLATPAEFGSTPFLVLGAPTPGIPGGTSNMHCLPKLAPPGWSGAGTPLAAMAGAQHLGGWLDASYSSSSSPSPPASTPAGQHHQNNHHHHHHQYYHQHQQQHHHRQYYQDHLHPSWSSPQLVGGGGEGQNNRASSQGSVSAADFPPPSPTNLAPPGQYPPLREKHSVSTLAATSTSASRPPTRDRATGPSLSGLAGSKAAIDENAAAAAAAAKGTRRRGCREGRAERGGVEYDEDEDEDEDGDEEDPPHRYHEPRPDDLQAVFRIRYAGDVRLMLTAEILLDYPMPSFVGIPVKLNITGLTFDGVGVLAYIRRRVHFCFLSPEDAVAAVGADGSDGDDDDDDGDDDGDDDVGDGGGDGGDDYKSGGDSDQNDNGDDYDADDGNNDHGDVNGGRGRGRGRAGQDHGQRQGQDNNNNNNNNNNRGRAKKTAGVKTKTRGRMGGLLQEIRVESEIGQREGAKQSLKNVGKVERFVLEQVRRIFEEEFVYPSFWTFLV